MTSSVHRAALRPIPLWRRWLAAVLALQMSAATVLSAALLPLLPLPAMAQVRLPSLGDTSSADLPIGTERKLGDQIMREVRRDPDFLDDPVLQDYLISVWAPLVEAARRIGNIDAFTDQALAWQPFLVRERSVNAFAWPGGYVGVHLGMIAAAGTKDQLASVLAHELSHVTQRHIARGIAPQRQASLVALAAMLLGVLAASRSGNTDIANAAIAGGQGAAIQGQLNFSRDAEREADRVGFNVLTAAGYAPAAMANMFESLGGANRFSDDSSYPYLRSHPLTVDRISEARNRTLLMDHPKPSVPTLEHAEMQARAKVLMNDGATALQRFNGKTASTQLPDRVGALYGGAMAASKLREPDRAQALVDEALKLAASASPREPRAERALQLLQVELKLASGKPAAALALLGTLPPLPRGPATAGGRAVAGAVAETGTNTDAVAEAASSNGSDRSSISQGSQAPAFSDPGYLQSADRRPPLLMRAQALLDLNRADPAAAAPQLAASAEALQTWVALEPMDAAAWQLLSSTNDALGLKLRALRAAAETQVALGDVNGAIDRLRAAQSVTVEARRTGAGQDFIEASVIDSRMRQLVALRRQYAIEAREQ